MIGNLEITKSIPNARKQYDLCVGKSAIESFETQLKNGQKEVVQQNN